MFLVVLALLVTMPGFAQLPRYECHIEMSQCKELALTLVHEMKGLGVENKFDWHIYSDEEWPKLMTALKKVHNEPDDPHSPIYSVVPKSRIVINAALIVPGPRDKELAKYFPKNLPRGEWLKFALTHELTHQKCKLPDEATIELYAQTGRWRTCL